MRKLGLLAILLICFTLGTGTLQANQPTPMMPHAGQVDENTGPLVIAHQGGDGLRPSNTMLAFEYAVEIGVDMLEMDIHSTSDGVLVVIHDDTVDRTTDGTGKVNEMTYAEVQQLDAAYHWPTLREDEGRDFTEQPEGEYPYRGQGVTIPALEDVLTAFPDMPMTIEIKQETPSIAEPFCAMLRDHDMTDQVIVASFSATAMEDFRAACPEVATSGVTDEIRQFFFLNLGGQAQNYAVPTSLTTFQVPEYYDALQVITPEFVSNAQALGIQVQAWTINTVEQMERMVAAGVNGIMTDYPDRLLELLGRTGEGE
ncbi:MAG: glycerophosphodiester phosphodiesterase [Anaerolineae bacterium]|nr:glycerophosphodiester phosphodiesterase [Anaerolineae bacterium]